MSKNGFSYYMAETDRFQDIKIKRLKKKYGCDGYAVYQYALNEIYRVEGCYIRFTEDQLFDCADYWDIPEPRIREIVDYCAEIGLFYAEIWRNRGILTARSIQTRYLDMCKRAKKRTYIPLDLCLVAPEAVQILPEPLPLFPEQKDVRASSGTFAKLPELSRNIPEKNDKEKQSKENTSSIPLEIREEEEEQTSYSLERLRLVVESLGSGKQDWDYIRNISDISLNDSPIWNLVEELRGSGGKYSFGSYVMPSLKSLVQAGRLHIVQIPVDHLGEAKRLLSRIGVPGHEMQKILDAMAGAGNEQILRDAVNAVVKSKGKITMPGRYILKQFVS